MGIPNPYSYYRDSAGGAAYGYGSPPLGPELIVNGDFSNGIVGWSTSLGTGSTFTAASGIGTLTRGTGAALAFQNVLTLNESFEGSIDVSNTSGLVAVVDNAGTILLNITTTGVQSFMFTHTDVSNNIFVRVSTDAGTVSFTDFSIRQLI